MSELYLENGEKFVVTTHRISVSFALYDIMLTTRNLILTDSSLLTFNPRKIPLDTVLSVNAGKIATGEPVITLTFIDTPGEGGQQPMNLIFTQNAGEQRKSERDVWIKNLMEQIVDLRQVTLPQELPGRDTESGIPLRASSSLRGIDMPPPHKSVIRDEPEVITFDVVPEESPGGAGERLPLQGVPEPESGAGIPAPVEPDISEERGEATAKTPEGGEDAKEDFLVPEDLKIPPVQVQPDMPEDHPEKPEPVLVLPERATPAVLPDQRSAADVPVPIPDSGPDNAMGSWPEIPPEVLEEIAKKSGEPFPGIQAAPNGLVSGKKNLPEIPLGILDEITRESGEPFQETVHQPPAEPVFGGGNQPEKPPAPGFSMHMLVAAALVIIIILAVAAGILSTFRATPATIPETAVTPDSTPDSSTLSPTPTQTPVGISPDGIFLLVSYNGSFTGYYGRPGNLNHVGGSGHTLYQVFGDISLLQVSFQKKDYSGSPLMLNVYNNGTLVLSRSTRVPMGSIEFIVDPATGKYPGGTPAPTSWTGLEPGQTY